MRLSFRANPGTTADETQSRLAAPAAPAESPANLNPSNRSEDDVSALCSRSGIDLSNYRTFRPQQDEAPNNLAVLPSVEDAPAIPAAARVPAYDFGGPALARRTAPFKPARRQESPISIKQPLSALRTVLDATARDLRTHQAGSTDAATLPAGSLSILSTGGGVGTTSILATLGRIFTLRRERVLLLEGNSSSLLPFYFGAESASSGSWLYRERENSKEISIRVVARRRDSMTQTGAESNDRYESDQSLFANVESHLGTVDRVLVDAWSPMAADVQTRLLHETSTLVVMVPDLRSVVRVQALLQFFENQRRLSGQHFRAHFLINQFDARSPLHQELHRSLSMQLGDRLLPFTIRRTEEVPLALAEGTSIIDYAPQSEVAQEFLRLADWLSMWQGTQADLHREQRAARGQM